MVWINYKWDKPVFYQAALYGCVNCGCTDEVYSNMQWITEKFEHNFCKKCGKDKPNRVGTYFIYRYGRYGMNRLDSDFGTLPCDKTYCEDCNKAQGGDDKFYWTEFQVECPRCECAMFFNEIIARSRMDG